MTVRVLVIEAHHLLRKGLCCMISEIKNFEVVGQASNSKDGIAQAMTLRPDLILIDFCMPGMTGFEAISHIKKRLPEVRTVILTEHDSEDYVREALRIGVHGYVLKDVSFDELASALKLIACGRKYFCNQTSMLMLDNCIQETKEPRTRTAWATLTERERAILKLVAEGYTNRAAAQFLCISCKTVEKHRASLMRKLALRNAAGLVMMAIELGLVDQQRRLGVFASLVTASPPQYTKPLMDMADMDALAETREARSA